MQDIYNAHSNMIFIFAGFDEVSSTGSDRLSGNSCDCCLCHLRAWSGDWVWGQGVTRQRNFLRKPFSRSQLDCAGDISIDNSHNARSFNLFFFANTPSETEKLESDGSRHT